MLMIIVISTISFQLWEFGRQSEYSCGTKMRLFRAKPVDFDRQWLRRRRRLHWVRAIRLIALSDTLLRSLSLCSSNKLVATATRASATLQRALVESSRLKAEQSETQQRERQMFWSGTREQFCDYVLLLQSALAASETNLSAATAQSLGRSKAKAQRHCPARKRLHLRPLQRRRRRRQQHTCYLRAAVASSSANASDGNNADETRRDKSVWNSAN